MGLLQMHHLGGKFQIPCPLTGCPTAPSKYLDGHTERLMKKYPRIHTDHTKNKEKERERDRETFEAPRPPKCHVTSFDSYILFWVLILLWIPIFSIMRNMFNPSVLKVGVLNNAWASPRAKARGGSRAAGSTPSDILSSLPFRRQCIVT